MVDEGAAHGEGVGEVKGGHGGQLVDILATDESRLSVVLADGVVEAVRFGEETWRHAWPQGEDEEGEEVAKGHGAAHC